MKEKSDILEKRELGQTVEAQWGKIQLNHQNLTPEQEAEHSCKGLA